MRVPFRVFLFVPGTLTIHKKGSGDGSGPDNEDPLIVRATDQQYSYNGATQGKVAAPWASTRQTRSGCTPALPPATWAIAWSGAGAQTEKVIPTG
jgi:hypothetical protein